MNALATESEPMEEASLVVSEARSIPKWRRFIIPGLLLLVILGLCVLALGVYVSRTPGVTDVKAKAMAMASKELEELPRGYLTASAVYHVGETLLGKSGGYLTNDVAPPLSLLDNMPSWEFGVLTELRDAVRSLRNDFSRAQTQSVEDTDLMTADAKFHFEHTRFMLPSTESEYRDGLAALSSYLGRLENNQANFFNRGDNLNFYLATVANRLGSLSQRLSASVRDSYLRELIYTDEDNLEEITETTPWNEIDNVFFEARGYVWALIHTLRGIQVDFDTVLANRNATEILDRIIKKLENTQRSIMSPVILNSSGFGMLTNHSLVMASYISRANAALIDLRTLLQQG